jgi:hypothetical protein
VRIGEKKGVPQTFWTRPLNDIFKSRRIFLWQLQFLLSTGLRIVLKSSSEVGDAIRK